MSTTLEPAPKERSSTPLASNNPFRNKINGSSSSATASKPPAVFSTNPFLDSNEVTTEPASIVPVTARPSPSKGATSTATDLLADLTLNGKTNSLDRRTGSLTSAGGSRGENLPPSFRGPSPGHRPVPSDEERRSKDPKLRVQRTELDVFADPPSEKKLPRRNSESSVRDKTRSLDPEEEKKRRERRQREQKSKLPKKPSKKLDVIDRLDVTSIYGAGLFHHDGPFDACNPHRNRKGARAAPMQAFPEGSLNMQLGGSGPLQKSIDIDQYHGRGQEAHGDYNEAAVVDDDADYPRRPQPERDTNFNPLQRTEPVHGSETAGLGTSTFLEGTPASRAAMERRESEYEQQALQQGLTRKKSLAQRIRRNRANTAEMRSSSLDNQPPGAFDAERRDSNGNGNANHNNNNNNNPFFKDHDQDYEKKATQIAFVEEEKRMANRGRTPSSPKREIPQGIYRTKTSDSLGEDAKVGGGGGFLSRVRSLKGVRRERSERRGVGG